MSTLVTKLDASQAIRKSYDDAQGAIKVIDLGAGGGVLVPEKFDDIVLTYVTSGNGVGEVETVTYSYLGSQVAVLTLEYDGTNNLIHVSRT